jgi:hypothetical protein
VFDYWLARKQRRIQMTMDSWIGLFFALPGILFASYELPVTLNTVDGWALFWQGAAAGAGLGAGLVFALRDFWNDARAEGWGFVLCLFLTGGAAAIHLNAAQPEAERTLVGSRVVDDLEPHGHKNEASLRRRWLRSVAVDWQGQTQRVAVDRDLVLREGSAVVLTAYDGRFGYPVIERVQRVE